MASLLDTGASYVDPTMAHFNREPVELIGRKSIVDFWRTSSQESSSQDIRYELKRCFTSGGLAVLTLELSISVSGAFWNVAKDRIDLHGYQTTVLGIEGAVVTSVIDYVDYAGVESYVDQLRAQYGNAP
jgi:hypothetical protein